MQGGLNHDRLADISVCSIHWIITVPVVIEIISVTVDIVYHSLSSYSVMVTGGQLNSR